METPTVRKKARAANADAEGSVASQREAQNNLHNNNNLDDIDDDERGSGDHATAAEDTVWRLLHLYFTQHPQHLVAHHIDSYNDFFHRDLPLLFQERNPVQLVSCYDEQLRDHRHKCNLYLGGRDGRRVYYGKPMVHDDGHPHYMYPNEARLRQMTYGLTVHFDVEVEFLDIIRPGEQPFAVTSEFLTPEELRELSGSALEQADSDDDDVDNDGHHEADGTGGGRTAFPARKDLPEAEGATDNPSPLLVGGKQNGPKKRRTAKRATHVTPALAAALRKAQEASIVQPPAHPPSAENQSQEGEAAAPSPAVHPLVQRRVAWLQNIYLGKFPILLQSDFCILQGMTPELRVSLGECRADKGGYFIVEGQEKAFVASDVLADNVLCADRSAVRICSASDTHLAKPKRTVVLEWVEPTEACTNGHIVAVLENVRAPIPLFVLFRALGVLSDKAIVDMCVLGYSSQEATAADDALADLLEPCVHHAGNVLQQDVALDFLGAHTVFPGKQYAQEILADYLFPHVGETNYVEKAFFLGRMVYQLLAVRAGREPATDVLHQKHRRVRSIGCVLKDLFVTHYVEQQAHIVRSFGEVLRLNMHLYEHNLPEMVFTNYRKVFGERKVDQAVQAAFASSDWLCDVDRTNAQAFGHQLRVVTRELRPENAVPAATEAAAHAGRLHGTEWGYYDFLDAAVEETQNAEDTSVRKTVVRKALALGARRSRRSDASFRAKWLMWMRQQVGLRGVTDVRPAQLAHETQVWWNGAWVGVVRNGPVCAEKMRLHRRNGLLPPQLSVGWDPSRRRVDIFTDGGRLMRPLFYKDRELGQWSFAKGPGHSQGFSKLRRLLGSLPSGGGGGGEGSNGRGERMDWAAAVSGLNQKRTSVAYDPHDASALYALAELYEGVDPGVVNPAKLERFLQQKAVVEYVDANESEHALVAASLEDALTKPLCTHLELHPCLTLGAVANCVPFVEHASPVDTARACSHLRLAEGVFHTNYAHRMDERPRTLLHYGAAPLTQSRLLPYLDGHGAASLQPSGENVVVAVMAYTGYNDHGAVLVNEGSLQRGLFHHTEWRTYSVEEERHKYVDPLQGAGDGLHAATHATVKTIGGTPSDARKKCRRSVHNAAAADSGTERPGWDYGHLDADGLVREGTAVDDTTVLVRCTATHVSDDLSTVAGAAGAGAFGSSSLPGSEATAAATDCSVVPRAGHAGTVDRTVLLEGEEGQRVASVRVRTDRTTAVGDPLAARHGFRCTVGLVVKERDMPFGRDGTRPDVIVHPQALLDLENGGASQLLECLIGKTCAMYGSLGDATAFGHGAGQGVNAAAWFGRRLPSAGFHSSGCEVLYNGTTGEQLEAEIFVGPSYFLRLQGAVADRVHSRASGPVDPRTRQPVEGDSDRDADLVAIGERERDGLLAHGLGEVLRESLMDRSDGYQLAICQTTGTVAIYNPQRDLFLSPQADGPVQFFRSETSQAWSLNTVTKHGRRFSVVAVPYALKLLMHELAALGIQLRLITEDHLQQMESLQQSEHFARLTLDPSMTPDRFANHMREQLDAASTVATTKARKRTKILKESPIAQPPVAVAPASLPAASAVPANEQVMQPFGLGESSSSSSAAATAAAYVEPPPLNTLPLPGSPEAVSAPGSGTGGSAAPPVHTVDDFKLEDQVFYVKSADLGLDAKRPWKITKIGPKFLTIETPFDPQLSRPKHDFLQIVAPEDVVKVNEFNEYEVRKAYEAQLLQQQQNQALLAGGGVHPLVAGGAAGLVGGAPAIHFAPTIKLVGGDDKSTTTAPPGGATSELDFNRPLIQMANGEGATAAAAGAGSGTGGGNAAGGAATAGATADSSSSLLGKIKSFMIKKLS
jgi:DNA-directed RNA polymerase II subunit RPB2